MTAVSAGRQWRDSATRQSEKKKKCSLSLSLGLKISDAAILNKFSKIKTIQFVLSKLCNRSENIKKTYLKVCMHIKCVTKDKAGNIGKSYKLLNKVEDTLKRQTVT